MERGCGFASRRADVLSAFAVTGHIVIVVEATRDGLVVTLRQS
jgi:hypothetical protein